LNNYAKLSAVATYFLQNFKAFLAGTQVDRNNFTALPDEKGRKSKSFGDLF